MPAAGRGVPRRGERRRGCGAACARPGPGLAPAAPAAPPGGAAGRAVPGGAALERPRPAELSPGCGERVPAEVG